MIAFIISFVAIQPINNYSNLLAASAEETVSPTSVTDGLLKYYIYPDHAELWGKDGTVEGEIIIPKIINNVPVTQINNMAFAACSKITSVTIPDSVVSIGPNAFANCSKLVSVKIPSSVTEIGMEAFKGTQFLANLKRDNPLVIINNILIDGTNCSGDIEIPENVKIIGAKAFYSCDKITSIIMPDGVIRVESSAFEGCKNLSSIEIPDSVINFGRSAFSNTPWLTNLLNNKPLAIVNHILIAAKNDIEIIEIPNDVTKIGDGAFYQSKVKSVIIPDGVKSIGSSAFVGSDLISITIPESVTNIEQGAFQNCKNLKSITVKNKDCVIYDNNKTISSDYSIVNMSTGTTKGVFSGIIEGSEGSTAQAYAQKYKYNFSALSEDFTDIIEDGLKYRRYNDHVEVVCAINPSKDLSIRSNINELPVTIIRDISSSLVENIILPSTVDYIENRAIVCSSLQSITITNRNCKIYDSSLTICNWYSSDKADKDTLIGRLSGTIYCYEGSTAHAYAEKYGFKYVELEGEEIYHDIIQDSVVYRIYSDHAKIIGCSSDDVEGELIIPTTIDNVDVTDIKRSAFYMCDKITKIKLPETMTYISDWAFEKCTNLDTVYFPDNLISIGKSAFSDCTKLTNITLNNGLKRIGESAFSGCSSIYSITIPDSVLNIDKSAFECCTTLESIIIMNKDCEIYDAPGTICNSIWYAPAGMGLSDSHNFSGTIYGYKDSTAKQYAYIYYRNFEELPEVSEITTTSLTSTTTTNTTTTTTQKSTTSTTASGQNQPKYPLGDVNNDGQINAVDASSVLSYYAMISTNKDGGFDDNQIAAADVNNDGQVNAVDASSILAYYAYASTAREEILSIEAFLKR